MKLFRLLAIVLSTLVILLLLAVGVAFNSSFQTWAVRRTLASRPGLHASVGSVSAGLQKILLQDVRFEQDGAVLTLPALAAELPLVSAGLRDRVLVSKLVSKGWTLDFSKAPAATAATVAPAPANAGAGAALQMFSGVFNHLQLPVDLALDGLDLEGEVILPAARGRMRVALRGGGLGVGREGKFGLTVDAALADPAVSGLKMRGTVLATMDTPRSFTRISAMTEAAATGTQFPQGVTLTSNFLAARTAEGETYSAAVVTPERQLLAVGAAFPQAARKLDGTWKLDVRDADVAPFTLGRPLPVFAATGAGNFDADPAFAAVHTTGRLTAKVDKLAVLSPQLAEIGAVTFAADFDLARRGEAIAVQVLNAELGGPQPIARLQSLQAFEFNPKAATLKAADPARELVAVTLDGVPLGWAKPFLSDIAVTGDTVRGELVVTARGGGAAVRSKKALTVGGLTVAQAGKTFVDAVDISFQLSGDYTPEGWQAEAHDFTAKNKGSTLFTLGAKAGQLAGKDQPLRATGRLVIDLPSLLQQPIAHKALALTRGAATIDFSASVAARKELQAKIWIDNLAGDSKSAGEKLPTLSADLRADIASDGQLTVNIPILIEREDRKSDVTVVGTLKPGQTTRELEARVTSNQLVIDDAKILAGLLPDEKAPGQEGPKASPKVGPPWAGINGTLNLQLKKVVYSSTFEASDVVGTLRLEGGAVKLETVRAGLGEGGEAKLSGVLIFDSSLPQPYTLAADLVMTDFDPGPLFRAINPHQSPTVEGRFNLSSQLASRAPGLADLAAGAGGNFQLTSRGGVFRGLPVNANNLAENTGRLAGWIASAGTAIGSLTGKKDYSDVANKAAAVAEFARGLNPIPYDQLSVVLSRDAALNTVLKDFTLISPEIRLSGSGRADHRPGGALLDDTVAMDFKLRARGRQGDLLKYLGALESQPDDLGYVACTLPLKVGGTLGRPDTSELNARLAAVALEKSGLSDKAAEFLNKLRGVKSADNGAAK